MLSRTSTSILQSAQRTIKDIKMVSNLSSYSPLLCCIIMIQLVAHIISILRLGFICFIRYCHICHTTTPKGSRLSCDGSGGHHPGSILVIQGAALHIQLAKAAIVAAVVKIAAPTGTRVAAA
jgi:hypothetical protein